MKKIVASELIRIADSLGFDTEMRFSELTREDDIVIRHVCLELQSEMDRIRANEGIRTVMHREDTSSGINISFGVSDHEAKGAIVNHLQNKAQRLCESLGVGVRHASRPRVARDVPRDKEKAREMVKVIRSRGLMHPFMRDTTLFGRPSEDGKFLEPEVLVELTEWMGMVHIAYIQSFEPGKGKASKALREIVELADEMGVTLHLVVSPAGSPVGGKPLSKSQLKSWYKRLGFTSKGGDEMYRAPA